ncbi:hypothetical protein BGZ83_011437 [Gryganskiella cystojenkinii]|nr:hypothetical protein BGZ83_011437 [Gryganskiella cystojenkinii]
MTDTNPQEPPPASPIQSDFSPTSSTSTRSTSSKALPRPLSIRHSQSYTPGYGQDFSPGYDLSSQEYSSASPTSPPTSPSTTQPETNTDYQRRTLGSFRSSNALDFMASANNKTTSPQLPPLPLPTFTNNNSNNNVSNNNMTMIPPYTPSVQYQADAIAQHNNNRSQPLTTLRSSPFSNPFKKLQSSFGATTNSKKSLDQLHYSSSSAQQQPNTTGNAPRSMDNNRKAISSSSSTSSLTSWRTKGVEILSKTSWGRIRKNSEPLLNNIQSSTSPGGPVFGTNLEEAVRISQIPGTPAVPAVLYRCAEFLEIKGVDEVGLYRVPGSHANVQKLKRMFDSGRDYNLLAMDAIDPNDIATLLKLYLRELPAPLLPPSMLEQFQSLLSTDRHICHTLRGILVRLPKTNYEVLSFLCHHLSKIAAHSDRTKMTVSNLGVVFAPTLSIGSVLFRALLGGFYDQIDTNENREKGLEIVWSGQLLGQDDDDQESSQEEENSPSPSSSRVNGKAEFNDSEHGCRQQQRHQIRHQLSMPVLSPFSDHYANNSMPFSSTTSNRGIGPLDPVVTKIANPFISEPPPPPESLDDSDSVEDAEGEESRLMNAMLLKEEHSVNGDRSSHSNSSEEDMSRSNSQRQLSYQTSTALPSQFQFTTMSTTSSSSNSSSSNSSSGGSDKSSEGPFAALDQSLQGYSPPPHVSIETGNLTEGWSSSTSASGPPISSSSERGMQAGSGSSSNDNRSRTCSASRNPFAVALQSRSRSNNPSVHRRGFELLASQPPATTLPAPPRPFVFRPPSISQKRPQSSFLPLTSSNFVRSASIKSPPPSPAPTNDRDRGGNDDSSSFDPGRPNTVSSLPDVASQSGGVSGLSTRSSSASMAAAKQPVRTMPRDYRASRAPALSIIEEITDQQEVDRDESGGQPESRERDEEKPSPVTPVPQRQSMPPSSEVESSPAAIIHIENHSRGTVESTSPSAMPLSEWPNVSTKIEIFETMTSPQEPAVSLFSRSSTVSGNLTLATIPVAGNPTWQPTGLSSQQPQLSHNMTSVFTGMVQELEVKDDRIRELDLALGNMKFDLDRVNQENMVLSNGGKDALLMIEYLQTNEKKLQSTIKDLQGQKTLLAQKEMEGIEGLKQLENSNVRLEATIKKLRGDLTGRIRAINDSSSESARILKDTMAEASSFREHVSELRSVSLQMQSDQGVIKGKHSLLEQSIQIIRRQVVTELQTLQLQEKALEMRLKDRDDQIEKLAVENSSISNDLLLISKSKEYDKEIFQSQIEKLGEALQRVSLDHSQTQRVLSVTMTSKEDTERRLSDILELSKKPKATSTSVSTSDDPEKDLFMLYQQLRTAYQILEITYQDQKRRADEIENTSVSQLGIISKLRQEVKICQQQSQMLNAKLDEKAKEIRLINLVEEAAKQKLTSRESELEQLRNKVTEEQEKYEQFSRSAGVEEHRREIKSLSTLIKDQECALKVKNQELLSLREKCGQLEQAMEMAQRMHDQGMDKERKLYQDEVKLLQDRVQSLRDAGTKQKTPTYDQPTTTSPQITRSHDQSQSENSWLLGLVRVPGQANSTAPVRSNTGTANLGSIKQEHETLTAEESTAIFIPTSGSGKRKDIPFETTGNGAEEIGPTRKRAATRKAKSSSTVSKVAALSLPKATSARPRKKPQTDLEVVSLLTPEIVPAFQSGSKIVSASDSMTQQKPLNEEEAPVPSPTVRPEPSMKRPMRVTRSQSSVAVVEPAKFTTDDARNQKNVGDDDDDDFASPPSLAANSRGSATSASRKRGVATTYGRKRGGGEAQ